MEVSWADPAENAVLTCSVDAVLVNYTITELEEEVENGSVLLPPEETSYVLSPVGPGRSYVVSVSFVNQVSESLNNAVGECGQVFRVLSAVFDGVLDQLYIRWNLRIKDTWGPEQVSFIQRCPLFGG